MIKKTQSFSCGGENNSSYSLENVLVRLLKNVGT